MTATTVQSAATSKLAFMHCHEAVIAQLCLQMCVGYYSLIIVLSGQCYALTACCHLDHAGGYWGGNNRHGREVLQQHD